MITLEYSPDAVRDTDKPPFQMSTAPSGENWEETRILDEQTGKLLGLARQQNNPQHTVRFFCGKGGLCAVITHGDLIYFGLPGSRILLSDTEVVLEGAPITGKPKNTIYPQTHTPQQTVTPQAMILGAGMATRFEPISGDTTGYSKPGVPLYGAETVITAIARHLVQHGFDQILVNTFYKPDALKAQLNQVGSGATVTFIDETAPSGTAGGLLKALQQGLVDASRSVLIIQGDAITNADLSFLLNTHAERHAAVTIGGQIVPDRDVNKYGIIETDAAGSDGQSGNITSFKEKPPLEAAGRSRFANAGFYVLAPEILPLFRKVGESCLAKGALYDYANDFFPEVLKALGSGTIQQTGTAQAMGFWAQAMGGYWSDIGNPTQYIEAVHDIYAGALGFDLPAPLNDYYDEQGVIYWHGASQRARAEGAKLSGNVVVAIGHHNS